MEIYPNEIREWTDYENQYKIAVAAVKWLDKVCELFTESVRGTSN